MIFKSSTTISNYGLTSKTPSPSQSTKNSLSLKFESGFHFFAFTWITFQTGLGGGGSIPIRGIFWIMTWIKEMLVIHHSRICRQVFSHSNPCQHQGEELSRQYQRKGLTQLKSILIIKLEKKLEKNCRRHQETHPVAAQSSELSPENSIRIFAPTWDKILRILSGVGTHPLGDFRGSYF